MLNINDLKNMTAADLRKIESAISKERRNAVNRGFKEMAKMLKEDGPMPVSTIAPKAGLAPAQVWNCNNKGKRQGAGVYYFQKYEKKTFICPEDGDSITITRRTPMVRLKDKK